MSNVLGYDVCGVKSEWYFNDAGYEVRASCTHRQDHTGAHSWQEAWDAAEKEDLDIDGDAETGDLDPDQEVAQEILTEAQEAYDGGRIELIQTTSEGRVELVLAADPHIEEAAGTPGDANLTADEQIRAMKALLLDAYSIKIPLHAARKLGPDRLRFLVGMCAGAWSGEAGPHYISGTEGRDLS